ncbi:hypothetical protein EIN_206320 [Entamoeba invadens IP1]|uniref:Uncharacterized protein n=2 Tax=Entamoeba invadens TaxID=33085 RepID=A0A0A1UD23_ENTIV|nr:hypothetical protein EIN_206320 [Entamoeba invadens IP1]ELP91645.1 hypothetical protein EIN_206320 [Entamoeba invadens IP1]BAN40982.1 hypothetical protein [Entamoeba invadens]|eukprot:XP_004258416.1 hypothetical protein EIN_206320 [Entamoeba invadens IP1]
MMLVFLLTLVASQMFQQYEGGTPATPEERVEIIKQAATSIFQTYPKEEEVFKFLEVKKQNMTRDYLVAAKERLVNYTAIDLDVVTKKMGSKGCPNGLSQKTRNKLAGIKHAILSKSKKKLDPKKTKVTIDKKTGELKVKGGSDVLLRNANSKIDELEIKINNIEQIKTMAKVKFLDSRLTANLFRRRSEDRYFKGQDEDKSDLERELSGVIAKLDVEGVVEAFKSAAQGIEIMVKEQNTTTCKAIDEYHQSYRKSIEKKSFKRC